MRAFDEIDSNDVALSWNRAFGTAWLTVNWITADEDLTRFRSAGYAVDGPIPMRRWSCS